MDDAIILAATSCERCLNALLWRYGCNDGYPPYSEQWNKTNTKCEICKTPGVWDWLMNETNVKTAIHGMTLRKTLVKAIETLVPDSLKDAVAAEQEQES